MEVIGTSDPLDKLSEQKINFGNHEMKFIDTRLAWESLKKTWRIDTPLEANNSNDTNNSKFTIKQKKSIAFKDFQDILEREDDENFDSTSSTLPSHARYEFVYYEPKRINCDYCHKSTEISDDRHVCRVCNHAFHEICLISRGFSNDALGLQSLAESKNLLGWSCPDCEGLFSLLTDGEQEEIIELFTNVSGDDGVIDCDEFLQLQKEEYHRLVGMDMPAFREKQELELFSKIDRDHTGTIDYWEFLPHIAVRFLSRRSPMAILNLLTAKEINYFKDFFKEMDEEDLGAISQSKAKQAYINWYKSKVKQSSSNYIDFEWYGGLKENPLLQSLKESLSIDEPDLEKENKELVCLVEWESYLKNCALHILSARANTGEQKPLIPAMPSFLYATGGCSSNDDDFLKLCDEAKKWTNYLAKKGFKL